jgi:hypothetical protein
MLYTQTHSCMHTITSKCFHSLFCEINFLLPACRPNFIQVARTTWKVDRARYKLFKRVCLYCFSFTTYWWSKNAAWGIKFPAILSLSLVVTIFTTRLNIQQFYVLPTQCIYVFCVSLRTNRIISLYNINWPVFITQCQFPDCHYAVFSISTN